MPTKKKILLINRHPPHGTLYPQESLDIALMGAAFDQPLSLAFTDDGVFQLVRNQQPKAIGRKPFNAAFAALGDFDIDTLYVDTSALHQRGLQQQDLLNVPCYNDETGSTTNAVQLIDVNSLSQLIEEQDIVLTF